MTAHWENDELPHDSRRTALEEWATAAVRGRGLSRRARIRPEELSALLPGWSPELVEIAVEARYLVDEDVPLDHVRFLVGHEIGELELKLSGDDVGGKQKEHAADCIGAELVGVEIAAAALEGHRRWQEIHGLPADDEGSASHPSTAARIRHVREHCQPDVTTPPEAG